MENETTKLGREQLSSITDQLLAKRKSNLKQMLNIEHRLQKVGEINGVEFYNDSKATDLNATLYSIQTIEKPLIWLVEGSDTKRKFKAAREIVEENVGAIILVGDDENLIDELIDEVAFIYQAEDLNEALRFVRETAEEGEVVLYSPACPATKNYKSYQERGEQFKKILNL